MNKIKKKLFGAAGLLAVAAMTFVAAIIPSPGAYAANAVVDVTINVPQSQAGPFSAGFTSPANHAQLVAGTGTLQGFYANATSLTVTMIAPDNSVTVLSSGATVDPQSGAINIPYTLDHGYGDYTFTVSGIDLGGQPQNGPSIVIAHHSAFFEILPDPDQNGDPIARVTYGPGVCGVRFVIISQDDPSKAPTYYPILGDSPISCKTADPDQDGSFDITIPMSKLDLEAGSYKITMISYGCLGDQPDPDNAVESNLPPTGDLDNGGNYIFDPKQEYTPPELPNTGMVSIGGMMIAQKDLTLAAIIAVVAVIGTFFAIKNRRQIKH